MNKELISAEEARKKSAEYELSFNDMLNRVASTVDSHSKCGERLAHVSFIKSEVSDIESEKLFTELANKGYETKILEGSPDRLLFSISW